MAEPRPIDYRAVLEQLRATIREQEARETELKGELAAVSVDLAELRQAVRALARLAGEPVVRRGWGRHAEAVRGVLQGADGPLRVGEIADRLLAAGHVLPADQRSRDSAICSALRRRPGEFRRLKRGLWALVEAGTNGI